MNIVDYYYTDYFGRRTNYLVLLEDNLYVQYKGVDDVSKAEFDFFGKPFIFDCELTHEDAVAK